jgi:16S rRNA (guanine1207-N2)-methyltransferase
MDAAALLADHARIQHVAWRVGDLEVPIATKVGVRGFPGVDGALLALAPALRRGRVAPAGRALDLSGAPAALPAWTAAAGVGVDWTVALGSAAAWAAAGATLAVSGARPALVAALPWEVEGPFDTIVWRPPADRGIKRLQAELAAVAAALAPDGTAVLVQHKDEGAQRAERAASERFATVDTVGREAGWRVSLLRGPRSGPAAETWTAFEAVDGPARALVGTFAAEKVDPGTAVLLRALSAGGAGEAGGARLLDLGSGTGLLARAALAAGAATVVAVDDDLAAVGSTAAQVGRRARVVHADLLRPRDPAEAPRLAPGSFDVVWCNPPFHVGRQVVGALSRAFLAAAFTALRPGGVGWFVANRALPYEREFAAWGSFADVTPAGERAFTVWRAVRGAEGQRGSAFARTETPSSS